MGQRDEDVAQFFADQAFQAEFVRGIDGRPQRADGDGLDVARLQRRDPLARVGLVQGDEHVALRIHALLDLDHHVAPDQRRVLVVLEEVGQLVLAEPGCLAPDTADLERVGETGRRDDRRPGGAAREQRIQTDRGAVAEPFNARAELLERHVVGLGRELHRVDDARQDVGGCRRLDDLRRAIAVADPQVGEGAANIGADIKFHGVPRLIGVPRRAMATPVARC